MVKNNNLDISLLNDTKNAVVFCYLVLRKSDYPYNITKYFQEAVNSEVWYGEGLKINSYLTNPSKISVILKRLEENQIIKLDKRERRRSNRSYYSINLEIFLNEVIIGELNEWYEDIPESKFIQRLRHLTREDIANLLKDYYFDPRIKEYNELDTISELNEWKKFDFYTVLYLFHGELLRYGTEIDIVSMIVKDPTAVWVFNIVDRYFEIYLDYIKLSNYRKDIGLMFHEILKAKKEGEQA